MKTAVFANVVVKFGRRDFLDHIELGLKAFFDDTNVRRRGSTAWYFLDLELRQIDATDPRSLCVFGRFVKDTLLVREQIVERKRLKQDVDSMQSSPSSFFVLRLFDHKLVYWGETRHNPKLSEFEATLDFFLRSQHERELKRLYKEQNATGRVTWKKLNEVIPKPSVNIVEFSSTRGIEEFVKRFEKIKTLTVKILERNSEIHSGNILGRVRERFNRANPEAVKLVAYGGERGMDSAETTTLLSEIVHDANQKVELFGSDRNGKNLRGNNDSFSATKEIAVDALPDEEKAIVALKAFDQSVDDGTLEVAPISEEDAEKIESALRSVSSI